MGGFKANKCQYERVIVQTVLYCGRDLLYDETCMGSETCCMMKPVWGQRPVVSEDLLYDETCIGAETCYIRRPDVR